MSGHKSCSTVYHIDSMFDYANVLNPSKKDRLHTPLHSSRQIVDYYVVDARNSGQVYPPKGNFFSLF